MITNNTIFTKLKLFLSGWTLSEDRLPEDDVRVRIKNGYVYHLSGCYSRGKWYGFDYSAHASIKPYETSVYAWKSIKG